MKQLVSTLTLLLFLTISCFGQNTIEYNINDISVQMPENYTITDTMGQRIVNASIENGLVLVITTPNEGEIESTLKDEEELLGFYKGFRKGHIKSLDGGFIREEIITKEGLKFGSFDYRATIDEEVQLRNCLVLFLKDTIYTFQFWQPESMENEMKAERDKFFSSIKIKSGFTIQDQLSFKDGNAANDGSKTDAYKLGFLIGKIIGILFGLGIVVGLIILVVVKLNK